MIQRVEGCRDVGGLRLGHPAHADLLGPVGFARLVPVDLVVAEFGEPTPERGRNHVEAVGLPVRRVAGEKRLRGLPRVDAVGDDLALRGQQPHAVVLVRDTTLLQRPQRVVHGRVARGNPVQQFVCRQRTRRKLADDIRPDA